MSSQVFWLTSWGLINIYPYKKEDYEDSRVYVVKETIKTDLVNSWRLPKALIPDWVYFNE